MKKVIATLVGLTSLITCAWAGNPEVYTFDTMSCETNAAAAVTNTKPDFLYGWVESVIVDVSGSANTGTVTVATVGTDSGLGASRTILSTTNQTTDAVYNPRLIVDTTAGVDIASTPCKIPLIQDKVRVTLYGFTSTNTTAKVYLVISDTPSP